MVSVYILLCEGNYYYIGKTSNDPHARIQDHFQGRGAVWTRLHKPIKIVKIIPDCIDEDEDKFTKMMMKQFGIEKVRGGAYCQVEIDASTQQFLQKELYGNRNVCFRCGDSSHFVKDCPVPINAKDAEFEKIVEDLAKSVWDVGKSIWNSIAKKYTTAENIYVGKIQVNLLENMTRIFTDPASVNKVRADGSNHVHIDDQVYQVIATKRDLSIFGATNYIDIVGCHENIKKSRK